MLESLGRILVLLGAGLLFLGGILLLLNYLGVPLGRLPGDFSWESGNTHVHVPLGSMIVVSLVLTLLINILLRIFR